jgi:glycosyltransferase involved in cell wall biosynthesis
MDGPASIPRAQALIGDSKMTNEGTTKKSVLLTVSGTIPSDIHQQISSGSRPRADYLELARALDADIIDYADARKKGGRIRAVLERLGGPNLLLAYACWKRRKDYRAILTDGEQIGLPLSALLKFSLGTRPRHIMIVHIISVPKKMLILDWLRVHSYIDRFLTYSRWQKNFIERRWKLGADRVVWTHFMVDEKFFAPDKVEARRTRRPQICAVGLERRDYPTLLQAVQDLDLDVVIAAASPWSKYRDTTSGQQLPDNVTVRKFTQYELRQLYADSRFLVMPLEPVDFQAGVTAILEAMAMGKAVLCSRVPGQTDVIVDGTNGRYVAASDPVAMRAEILRLLNEPDEADRLGSNGRQLVEREMSLDVYAKRLADIVSDAISESEVSKRTAQHA